MAVPLYRSYDRHWEPGAPDEQRFRRILRNVFVVYAVLALLIPFLPLEERADRVQPALPERVVQLVIEQPPPEPPAPRQVEQPPPELPVARVEPKPRQPVPATVQPERRVSAREKAQQSGLLALQDELAQLRDNDIAARLDAGQSRAGSAGTASRVERSLITAKSGRGSGGINTAAMSRDTGGSGLTGRATTQVASTVAAGAEAPARGADGRAARSREEIEMVFDQNKGAIYALYSRALRRDPTLQGKLVLKLTIEPDGAVSSCEVVSSELADEELLAKLVARVKMFRFPDRDVAQVTTTKPIDFFPA